MADHVRTIDRVLGKSVDRFAGLITLATAILLLSVPSVAQAKNVRLDLNDSLVLIRSLYVNNLPIPPHATQISLQNGVNVILVGMPGLSEAALVVQSWQQQISIIEEIRWALECNAGLLTSIEARPYAPAQVVDPIAANAPQTIKLYPAFRTKSKSPADYLFPPGCVFARQGAEVRAVHTSNLRDLAPSHSRHLTLAGDAAHPRVRVVFTFGSLPASYEYQFELPPYGTLGLVPAYSPRDPTCQAIHLDVRSAPRGAQIITLDENRNPTLQPTRTDSALVFSYCSRAKEPSVGLKVYLIEEKKSTKWPPGGVPVESTEVRHRQMETRVNLLDSDKKIIRFWFDRGEVSISPR